MGIKQFVATVNIHEGFALIYRLCLRNKDIFAEDVFAQVLIVLRAINSFHYFRLFHNEIRGSILLQSCIQDHISSDTQASRLI